MRDGEHNCPLHLRRGRETLVGIRATTRKTLIGAAPPLQRSRDRRDRPATRADDQAAGVAAGLTVVAGRS